MTPLTQTDRALLRIAEEARDRVDLRGAASAALLDAARRLLVAPRGHTEDVGDVLRALQSASQDVLCAVASAVAREAQRSG